jgi:hypothetical protein
MYRGVWFKITERVGLLLQKGVVRGNSFGENRRREGVLGKKPLSSSFLPHRTEEG